MEKLKCILFMLSLLAQMGLGIYCIFNPAGQDDIGGGCGQLWYFQDWLKHEGINKS